MFIVPEPKRCAVTSDKKLFSMNSSIRLIAKPSLYNIIQHHFKVFKDISIRNDAELSLKLVLLKDCSCLDAKDEEFFSSSSSKQSYILKTSTEDNSALVLSNSDIGLLYGAISFLQLLEKDEALSCPEAVIYDYPSFEYRAGSRWLLCGEGCRWSYDWGDGRANLIARFKKKLDQCLQSKINMVFFDGFDWGTDKYDGYIDDMKELSSYAIPRGIKLVFGGYGIGIGGWGGGNILTEAHNFVPGFSKQKNRKYYPDGPVYKCCGNNPKDQKTREHGNCRSNEELNKLIAQDLIDYVKKVEPGTLYIHHEDNNFYTESTEVFWAGRCDDCRKKWPSDKLEDYDGAAGAIAAGYNNLCRALFSVENPETGYKASRDCVIVPVSPAYGDRSESDQDWDKLITLWTNISKQLEYKDNVFIGMREQFWRKDDSDMRIREFSKAVDQNLFLFAVGGADYYSNDALFTATPVLNNFFEGAKAIFNFTGIVFQNLQELFTAEFAWNIESNVYCEKASSDKQAQEIYEKYTYYHYIPTQLSSKGGFLEKCCSVLYGETAGKLMKQFYLLGKEIGDKDSVFPFVSAYFHFEIRDLFLKQQDLNKFNIESEKSKWANILELTQQGSLLVEKALACDDFKDNIRFEVEQLAKFLNVGVRFSSIILSIFTKDDVATSRIDDLENYISDNFKSDFLLKTSGEIGQWPIYIERLKEIIKINKEIK